MTKTDALVRRQSKRMAGWMPGGARMMLDAQSRVGRSVKVSLFVVGAILPLGSLIWAALLWHGVRHSKERESLPETSD